MANLFMKWKIIYIIGLYLLIPLYAIALEKQIHRPVDVTYQGIDDNFIIKLKPNTSYEKYRYFKLPTPPRIVIDLVCKAQYFKPYKIELDNDLIKRLRLAYHTDRIRCVLDIKGKSFPDFNIEIEDKIINIIFKKFKKVNIKKGKRSDIKKLIIKKEKDKRSNKELEINIKNNDELLYEEIVFLFKQKRYRDCIKKAEQLIRLYPHSRFCGYTYLLRAKSYFNLYSDSLSKHFYELKEYLNEVVYGFPETDMASVALSYLADLYREKGDKDNAIALYERIKDKIKERKDEVLYNLAHLYLSNSKVSLTLKTLNQLIHLTKNEKLKKDAIILKAKILYKNFSYRGVINTLKVIKDKEIFYKDPELTYMLSNSLFQLKRYKEALNYLFIYYNMKPDDLTLVKIGDCYKNQKLLIEALTIYRIVILYYPKSEGSIISKIRIAEIFEENRGIQFKLTGYSSPKRIYEDLLNLIDKKEERLKRIVTLKLAMLYLKNGQENQGLILLKNALAKSRNSKERLELQDYLKEALQIIFEKYLKNKRYKEVVTFYEKEKQLCNNIEDPYFHAKIAESYIKIGREKEAETIFRKIERDLPDNQKPPSLLYLLSKKDLENNDISSAQKRIDLFLKLNLKNSEFYPSILFMKARICKMQNRYLEALRYFQDYLKLTKTSYEKIKILKEELDIFITLNQKQDILDCITQLSKLIKSCKYSDVYLVYRLGELFKNFGNLKEAVELFKIAYDQSTDLDDKAIIKLKIARCYKEMGKLKEYLKIFNQLANMNAGIWTKIAREKIEDIYFEQELRKRRGI